MRNRNRELFPYYCGNEDVKLDNLHVDGEIKWKICQSRIFVNNLIKVKCTINSRCHGYKVSIWIYFISLSSKTAIKSRLQRNLS